jgi:Protein of unknown function (DUF2846)
MKNALLMLAFLGILDTTMAQNQAWNQTTASVSANNHLGEASDQPEVNTESKAEIYVLRNTGIAGSAVRFRSFLNGELLGKIHNKRLEKYEITAGSHEFSVQFHGKKKRQKGFTINVEPGKKYYLMMVIQYGWFVNKLYAVEVSESSAERIMKPLKSNK